MPGVDDLQVRRLGIHEHRNRSVRWFRNEHGVLGIVDDRDSAAVGGWLAARSPAWRARIEV